MKNPPAFPTGTGVTPYNPGMTLRDYFAAKAMQGFLASPLLKTELGEYVMAKNSYRVADAMMEAREA
jgi:hypothetical protein